MKDMKKTYELSVPYAIPKHLPPQIPYRHLVTLVQLGETYEDVRDILIRTNQLPSNLDTEDDKHLKQRTHHAQYWLEHYAPEQVKFTIQQKVPPVDLNNDQRAFLSTLKTTLPSIDWHPDVIHNSIYEISKKTNIPIKTAFKTLYQILLNQEQGPRAGYFLSNLDKTFVEQRLNQVLT